MSPSGVSNAMSSRRVQRSEILGIELEVALIVRAPALYCAFHGLPVCLRSHGVTSLGWLCASSLPRQSLNHAARVCALDRMEP
jgi:hypothetical protein